MDTMQLEGQCGMLLLVGLSGSTEKSLLGEIASELIEVDDDDCGCEKCDAHGDPVATMKAFGNVMWTDVVSTKKKPTPGERLTAYIKAKKLGTIIVSPALTNAGNKNEFRVFIFTPNKKFLKCAASGEF